MELLLAEVDEAAVPAPDFLILTFNLEPVVSLETDDLLVVRCLM